jgi:GTP pyrophosphokinase
VGRIKDYISFPKPNGYQALHTTVICSGGGQIVEIQVKTKKMHADAEYGICAHWATKEGINLKTQGKKFTWVQQLKDWQIKVLKPEEFLEGLKVDFLKNRIFVFTPKGDVIDLPEGATAIDFAYAVHTDIGNRCIAAKVNGKILQLSQPLKNGDVVEIIVDKNKKPSRDWLNFVKTSLARSRIKSWVKKEERTEKFKNFFKEKIKIIQTLPKLHPQPQRTKTPKSETIISLAGQTGLRTYLAKCCSPHVGDEVKAYITQNRGAAVHRTDCHGLTRMQKKWPQKIVEATWKKP